jgi:hypothetical protein
MKRLLYTFISLLLLQLTHAQNVVKIQPGTTVKVIGNTNITLADMSFDNDGIFLAGAGTILFSGNSDAAVSGTAPMLFYNLQMAKKGSGKLSLQKDIYISSGITFNTGNIDLNGRNIGLAFDALLNNESDNSRVIGSTGGYIEIAANLNAPAAANPGNLGAVITSSQNLELTTIRRGHVSQKNAYSQGNTILRYYDIEPTNNSNLNVTLRINYLEPELNTLSEPLLSIWSSTNNISWKSLGFSSLNNTDNFAEQAAINTMGRFTLSSINNALPLRFVSFNVRCDNGAINLQWKTADEINTSHFVVERSSNGVNYSAVARVQAGGSSYAYKDNSAAYGRIYYRIVAFDLDGSKYFSGINNTSCNTTEGLQLAPNPAKDYTWVTINTPTASRVTISLYNNKGQLVQSYRNNLLTGSNQLPLQVAGLPTGTYHGVASWGAQRQSFTLIKGVQ